MASQIIHIEPAAPSKPAAGQTCNGCGVCCLVEPCPLGRLLSRRRRGACMALRWDERGGRYVCGAVTMPDQVLLAAIPGRLGSPLRAPLLSILRRMAARWIAAGGGCDCSLEVQRPAESDRQSTP